MQSCKNYKVWYTRQCGTYSEEGWAATGTVCYAHFCSRWWDNVHEVIKFYWTYLSKSYWRKTRQKSQWVFGQITYNSVLSGPKCTVKEVKVAHIRLPSVGFRSWSRFLAVSLQVTWVINPVVCCHYFLPGLQLPPQHLRGLLPILWTEAHRVWTVCLRLLPNSVAAAIWTQALLCRSPAY